jgi:desulfoferrodoxin (superoxide reductase-like protein)
LAFKSGYPDLKAGENELIMKFENGFKFINKMKVICVISSILVGLTVLMSSCTQNDGGIERVEGDRVIAPNSEYYKMYGGENPKYFTTENPGKWKGHEAEHLPEIKFSESKGNKYINVSMNMVQRPDHYIESIILLDHVHQEITSVPFDRYATGKARTDFFLGNGEIPSKFYVVVKCSKHDMWETPVLLTLEQTADKKQH